MIFAERLSKKMRVYKNEVLEPEEIDLSGLSRKIARLAYLFGAQYASKKKIEEKLDIQMGTTLCNQAQAALTNGNEMEALRLINLARRYLR